MNEGLGRAAEAVAQTEALHHVLGKLRPGANFDAMEKKVSARYDEIRQLEAQIPDPPQSFMDLLAGAEIARFGAGRNENGGNGGTNKPRPVRRPAARLIDAVIQFGEGDTSRK